MQPTPCAQESLNCFIMQTTSILVQNTRSNAKSGLRCYGCYRNTQYITSHLCNNFPSISSLSPICQDIKCSRYWNPWLFQIKIKLGFSGIVRNLAIKCFKILSNNQKNSQPNIYINYI